MPVITPSSIAFYLHILIEVPAALTFILRPSSQLSPLTPDAALLLRSLGGLLLATVLIALAFAHRSDDYLTCQVSFAFAFWHAWPCYRAVMRLVRHPNVEGSHALERQTSRTLGGPPLHLAVHFVLLSLFLWAWKFGHP